MDVLLTPGPCERPCLRQGNCQCFRLKWFTLPGTLSKGAYEQGASVLPYSARHSSLEAQTQCHVALMCSYSLQCPSCDHVCCFESVGTLLVLLVAHLIVCAALHGETREHANMQARTCY